MPRSGVYFTIIGVFQFVSMAFLIICCVTAPVFKQIGLAKHEEITYGVFGYCTAAGDCSKASGSYDPYSLTNNPSNWKLSNRARKQLGYILIVMPVAAGLNFFALVTTAISLVLSFIHRNESVSAVTFIINLIFEVLSFFSSSLMCIVVFLLFYPNVTWCTWLLIPAAVLPLLSLPLIFVSYMSNNNSSIDDEMVIDNNQRLLSVDDLYENSNSKSNLLNSHTVLPDINPSNMRDDGIILTNTSDTEDSSLDKEKYNIYSKTANDLMNSQDNLDINDPNNEKDSMNRFSVIDNDKEAHLLSNNPSKGFNPAGSLASSVYSQKDHYSELPPRNKILQDILKDSNKAGSNSSNELAGHSVGDKDSLLTSISRNGVDPRYYADNNNNNHLNAGQHQNVPYPYTPSMADQSVQGTQSGYSNVNYNNIASVPRQQNNPRMHMNMPMQYQYSNQQPPLPPAGSGQNASDMILQNNPNFLPPSSSRMNPRTNRQMPGGAMPQSGSTHFAPAYKRRMNNRANTFQNLNSANDSPYNFR